MEHLADRQAKCDDLTGEPTPVLRVDKVIDEARGVFEARWGKSGYE